MGITFGGFIVEHVGSVLVPRPMAVCVLDPMYDGEDEPDSSADVLAMLYRGKVLRTDELAHVHQASSRSAEKPHVAFHRRCVIVFDGMKALDCDFESSSASTLNGVDARLAEFSTREDIRRVMVFSLESTSGTYAFAVFEGGARVRRWAFIPTDDAPIVVDDGAPLPTEPPAAEAVHGETRIDAASATLLDTTILEIAGEHAGPVFVCDS